jgi:hypothetical protein
MMLLVLDNPKYFKFLLVILSSITTVLCVLLVDHYRQTLDLEKELARINRELLLKEIIHDQRVKKFEQDAKERQQQVQHLRYEVLLKIKKEK